jgi:hypothetical protein
MANSATVNPTADQAILRNIGRIKTLRAAIEKNTARDNPDKVASLQQELDRRMAEVDAIKAELDAL